MRRRNLQLRFPESSSSSRDATLTERDFPLEKPLKDIASSKRVHPFSSWRLPSIADTEFAADKVDYGKMPETLSRAAAVPPSDSLDDPFVADDTFQDQGPGSVEIYKLDLSKEKVLLTATTPSANLTLKNKGKAPKKTGRLDLTKTKVTDVKPTTTTTTMMTDAKIYHRQSNFFDEQRTETPIVNRDAFDVGGVPELQVGCEGLEASSSSYKAKRSIDTSDRKKEEIAPTSILLDVTPVSLDFEYDLSYDDADFEEMDELFKLKRLETTTKRNKPNRGDMDASHLNSDHLDETRRLEKLPVRGDLGKSTGMNSSESGQSELRQPIDSEIKNRERSKGKRRSVLFGNDDGANQGRGRRLLWLAAANTEGFAGSESERKRAKRSMNWGFGENEGVVSSDELQTVNERRRQHEMRYHQNATRRRDQHHEANPEIDNIRRQYEQLLEQKQREEEERLRRTQQSGDRGMWNRWDEEERRRNEMRRRQYEEYRRRMNYTSTPRANDEETRRRQMEERRRQEQAERNRMQEMTRKTEVEQKRPPQNRWQTENTKDSRTPVSDEERRRKTISSINDEEIRRRAEEARRQDRYRLQEEAQRRKEAEERQRQEESARKLSENDKRRLEQRRREWAEKKRQEEEDERRRQQAPSNLMRTGHQVSQSNDIRQRDRDEERRMLEKEERRREHKLREYIARNQPININRTNRRLEQDERRRMHASGNEEYRKRMEEQRRKQEEQKLQDYITRNQLLNLPKSNATSQDLLEERRRIEEARHRGKYPESGARKHHGPSASTYIDPRSSLEEVRQRQQETARRLEEERRQRYEAEERRKQLARRQQEEEEEKQLREERMRKEEARREEEARLAQSRRYEEDRKRLEAARLQAERRRQEMLRERSRNEAGRTRRPEATRTTYYQDPRLLAEYKSRQESRPMPSNLMLNQAEARRAAAERERQETERRREEENRYVRECFLEQGAQQESSFRLANFICTTLSTFFPAIVHLLVYLGCSLLSFCRNKRYFA